MYSDRPFDPFPPQRILFQNQAIEKVVWQCCLNCEHWIDKPEEQCGLAGSCPPATIIVTGCPSWEVSIPF